MYSERPPGRALTVREAYSRAQHDPAGAAAAGGYEAIAGEPGGGWRRPGSAGVGGWCVLTWPVPKSWYLMP